MSNFESLKTAVGSVSKTNFEALAIEIYKYQANNNKIFKQYLKHLNFDYSGNIDLKTSPFLPISFFKRFDVKSFDFEPQHIFESSGTTDQTPSRHLVEDEAFYFQIARRCFENIYGNLDQFCVLALLPSYLERKNASLVHMTQHFIHKTKDSRSGFYLDDYKKLKETLLVLKNEQVPTILLGVSFALLDFAESNKISYPDLIVMETGGMKGRRKEMTRPDLHERLCQGFGVANIHSEYGMTELMSQVYAPSNGRFNVSPSMQVNFREINDPFKQTKRNQQGLATIIDLANIHSCSFILTEDLGRALSKTSFEILGRLDSSELRGCNLMLSDII